MSVTESVIQGGIGNVLDFFIRPSWWWDFPQLMIRSGDAGHCSDANGDGLSQAGELFTLADAGVQSLTTAYSQSTAVDAHGNAHKQIGGYTRADGVRRISRAGLAGNARRLSARHIPFGGWSSRFPQDYPTAKFQYA